MTSDPLGLPSPEQYIDAVAETQRTIMRRLLAQNDELRRTETDLNVRLQQALDKVADLEARCAAKDKVICELQELATERAIERGAQ